MQKEKLFEIIRFVIAGVVGFIVELTVLVLLKEKLDLDTLIATPVAFILSVAVNYLMCVFWVFRGVRQQNRKSQLAFLLTSAIGLILNEIFMLLFRVIWGENYVLGTVFSFTISMYMLNKIISTCIVMVWNYYTKRLILTKK